MPEEMTAMRYCFWEQAVAEEEVPDDQGFGFGSMLTSDVNCFVGGVVRMKLSHPINMSSPPSIGGDVWSREIVGL